METKPELPSIRLVGFEGLQYARLDGGAAADDGKSSSGSLERLRLAGVAPRLAADMLGRSGELEIY